VIISGRFWVIAEADFRFCDHQRSRLRNFERARFLGVGSHIRRCVQIDPGLRTVSSVNAKSGEVESDVGIVRDFCWGRSWRSGGSFSERTSASARPTSLL
jgi:hypothetical protein